MESSLVIKYYLCFAATIRQKLPNNLLFLVLIVRNYHPPAEKRYRVLGNPALLRQVRSIH